MDPSKRCPVVIFVAGGAWTIGYKAWGALMGKLLIDEGKRRGYARHTNISYGGGKFKRRNDVKTRNMRGPRDNGLKKQKNKQVPTTCSNLTQTNETNTSR